MTKETIEQQATQILREEKISRLPISAERLAESYFGLDFDCGELDDNELAGLKIAEKKIYMNESRADELVANVGLKNFTIAHELGHWTLHKNLVGKRSRQIEREADWFATCLLMPEKWVREEFSEFKVWLPAEMKVDSLAKIFCVSRTAMKIRLSQRELKLIYVDFNDYSCYRSKEDFLEQSAGQMKLF
ncbi:MAG: ImmA/IrrE family metallo-endopeptidase [Selenomonadaceae bacterium]|nr:ImmA/IrrE family metallo-endopeptidase [Selenomonadaceae bacterium]